MTSNLRLTDHTAVVTGAASGIGHEIALRLAQEGCNVLCADLDETGVAKVANEIGKSDGRAESCVVDVTDPDAVDAMVGMAKSRFGGLDILVNSAAIMTPVSVLDCDLEMWNRTIGVNLTGTFLTSQRSARVMIDAGRKSGRIINISSVNGERGSVGRVAYGASKGGVNLLTKVMAVELGSHGITVNAIAPGPIDTPMTLKGHSKATRTAFNKMVPLGRYGEPSEVAGCAAFLASADASYVTGQILCVDGGWAAAGVMAKFD